MPIRMRFYECFNVYNILMGEEGNVTKFQTSKNLCHV